jgi:N-hydroxyarylamine O-acetyltransferase
MSETPSMQPDAYLDRIGYTGPRELHAEVLRQIHRAHMLAVPFENLDIALGRPIPLSLPAFYDKIVRRRRGGFCYELNGLFGWLLERLGFAVTILSARVFHVGQPGPDFEHVLLLVEAGERLIADVGFGDSFLEPLPLELGSEVEQAGSLYRLTAAGDARVLERRREGVNWEPQFSFTLTPRRLAEFGAECHRLQASPESPFTRKAVCSLPTAEGRLTLSGNRLIRTTRGLRAEEPVGGEREYRSLLRAHFGVELDEAAAIGRLMAFSAV